MADISANTPTTPTSYDLISLNGVSLPDVKKGTLAIQPNPKYIEHECADGGKVIEPVSDTMIKGEISYNGLLQSEIQTIMAAYSLVSTLVVYNPATGTTKTCSALILPTASEKKIHDGRANAWSWGFEFEEIGNA